MEGLWCESHSSTNQSEISSLIHSINPVITLVNFRDYILLIIILTDLTFPLKKIILSWKWKWKLLSHVQLFVTHPMDYTVQGTLQARVLEWVAFPFSNQRIFPTQGSNPGLLHCRQILYQLNHKGRPTRLLYYTRLPYS